MYTAEEFLYHMQKINKHYGHEEVARFVTGVVGDYKTEIATLEEKLRVQNEYVTQLEAQLMKMHQKQALQDLADEAQRLGIDTDERL